MKTDSFDFSLPKELISQTPLPERDKCKLMVLKKTGEIHHRVFSDVIEYLSEGDLLILNDTKVFPARLVGQRPSGNGLEVLIVRETAENEWEILSRGNYSGRVQFSDTLDAVIKDGKRALFSGNGDLKEEIRRHGKMPLPPYIKREASDSDREWYQTVFAKQEGSIAAPTAGLHFTKELIDKLIRRGVVVKYITLHVGLGTFRPLKTDRVEKHRMHGEYFEIDFPVIETVKKNKSSGKRVVAVGTTTTRALEGCFNKKTNIINRNGKLSGYTDIFIYPGYTFSVVDCLVTNFHVPKSTPILLASALAGRENLLNGYDEAIRGKYRFFSYGDAMLIL